MTESVGARAWPGGRVARRFSRSSTNLGELELLPFLDILVSALAVFLLIVALQTQLTVQQAPILPGDVLILLDSGGQLTWTERGTETTGQSSVASIGTLLRTLEQDLHRPPRLLVAFPSDAIDTHRQLQEEFNLLATRNGLRSNGSVRLPGTSFRVIWWPINSGQDAGDQLLGAWRSANRVGTDSTWHSNERRP